MAAESRVSMNRITKKSGMALLIYWGIIRSTFPFAAAIEIRFWVLKKYTFESAPTVNETPVIIKIKGPPTRTALLRALSSLTVINLTASCGWARTPIPTPRTSVETRFHQMFEPNAGIAVHPRCPCCARASGTSGAISVSSL